MSRKDIAMTLLEQWRNTAYSENTNKGDLQRFWTKYFEQEKEIYAQLLADPKTEVKGTVKELAEKYDVTVMTMTGFLDGINDSLKEANPIETMDEDTVVSLMSQYTPCHLAKTMPDINRPIKQLEYTRVLKTLERLGLDKGFYQELSSSTEEYIPIFDGRGVVK